MMGKVGGGKEGGPRRREAVGYGEKGGEGVIPRYHAII